MGLQPGETVPGIQRYLKNKKTRVVPYAGPSVVNFPLTLLGPFSSGNPAGLYPPSNTLAPSVLRPTLSDGLP